MPPVIFFCYNFFTLTKFSSQTGNEAMRIETRYDESVREIAELRRKTQRKQDIERKVIQHREELHEIFEAEAVKRKRRAEIFA